MTYALEKQHLRHRGGGQWLRDGLGIIDSAEAIEPLAASVESADGVYFMPAFVGLGAPQWDAYARHADRPDARHDARPYRPRPLGDRCKADVLAAIQADSGITLSSLRVDGGAARNNLLMQIRRTSSASRFSARPDGDDRARRGVQPSWRSASGRTRNAGRAGRSSALSSRACPTTSVRH